MSKRSPQRKQQTTSAKDLGMVWRAYKSKWAKLVTDPSGDETWKQAQASTRALHQTIGDLGARKVLDRAIAQAPVTLDNRRVLSLDVIDALSGQMVQDEGQPTVYLIWGMAVTAEIGQLLQLHRQCNELGHALETTLDSKQHLVVGLIPEHLACAMSPQAFWSVGASLIGGCWQEHDSSETMLAQLRTAMEGYFVPHHCNLDTDLRAVGSAVMMIATRHTQLSQATEEIFQGHPPAKAVDQWLHAMESLKAEHGWNLMTSMPRKWSEATADALIQYTDSQWVLGARITHPDFSVLMVDEVILTVDDHHLTAQAWVGGAWYASCDIAPAAMLWSLPMVVEQWKRRGISVRGYEQIMKRG